MSTFFQLIFGGLETGSIFALATLGIIIIFRTSRATNFAQGTIGMINAYVAANILVNHGEFPVWLAVIIGMASAFVTGVLIDLFIIRRANKASIIGKQVITFGLILILMGIAPMIFGAVPIRFPRFIPTGAFELAGARFTYLLIGLVLASLPLLSHVGIIRGDTVLTVGAVVFYAIAALGMNVLLGYSGLVSLGTAGFMGLGAYLTTHLTVEIGLSFWVALPIVVAIPTIIGILVGLVSLRLSGMYLAIATLAVAEVARRVFMEVWGFVSYHATYPDVFVTFLGRDSTYWLLIIILVLLMILTDNFIHSPIGRAFLTMRASEPAAQAMGISLFKYKLMAFGIATAYATLAGMLYAHFIHAVDPTPWTLLLSLQIIAVIVIGGFKTITGPIVGSFIVFGVPHLILNRLPIIGDIAGLPLIFNGILIIIVILFYPRGLVYLGNQLFKKKEVESS